MAIERAVVKGTMADLVHTRSMFTADVTPVGGDTSELLWGVYLDAFYATLQGITGGLTSTQSYELQSRVGGQWLTTQEVAFSHTGTNASETIADAVSIVLVGKAEGIGHLGRKFLGGLTEGVVVSNTITSGALAVATSLLVDYISPVTGVGGGTLVPGVVTSAGVFHRFVGGVVSSILGSMRRRKPGIGI